MAKSVQLQKVQPWMERLADLMIAYPEARLKELAQLFGRSATWLSIAKNSDVFKDYWRVRSEQHSLGVTGDIKSKAFAAVELALDNLNEKLETMGDQMTADTLLQIVDVNTKRFAPTAVPQQAPQINFNLGLVTADQLAEARAKLRQAPMPQIALQPEEQGDGS